MKKLLVISIVCLFFTGCQQAYITAVKWDTGISGDNLQTRCVRVDMREDSEMAAAFAKYDGWKLVYLSEYTTGNKVGTDGVVCFQHAKK